MKRPFIPSLDEQPAVVDEPPYFTPDELEKAVKRYQKRARAAGLNLIAALLEVKPQDDNLNRP
jgi:hypothetical protein